VGYARNTSAITRRDGRKSLKLSKLEARS